MKNIDDVLSSMVISLKIKTKEEKFILKTGLEVAFEMGKRDEYLEGSLDEAAFMLGEQDCLEGKAAKDTISNSYNRGYAARYALEQTQQWLSERSEQNVRPL